MPYIRRRVKVYLGSSDDELAYEFDKLEERDFVLAGHNLRLYSTTAWIGPDEVGAMPDTVDLLVENTDAADDIRVYYDFADSAYKTLEPGESYFISNLEKGTSPNEWRIIGQGAGLVDCRVTIIGDY